MAKFKPGPLLVMEMHIEAEKPDSIQTTMEFKQELNVRQAVDATLTGVRGLIECAMKTLVALGLSQTQAELIVTNALAGEEA